MRRQKNPARRRPGRQPARRAVRPFTTTPTVRRLQSWGRAERQVLDVARELVSTFGSDAWNVASMHMAECAAVGDQQSWAMWEAVTMVVDFLLQRGPAPEQALH